MPEDKKIAAVLRKYEKNANKFKALAPLDFMVHCLFREYDTAIAAAEAIARLQAAFINYNDIRVARWTEVANVLLPFNNADVCTRRLRDLLNRLFDRCGMMSLQFLSVLKINEAKRSLANLEPNLNKEILLPVLYMVMPNFQITISNEALNLAKQHGLISRNGTRTHLQKALANSGLSSESCGRLVQYLEIDTHKKTAPKKKK